MARLPLHQPRTELDAGKEDPLLKRAGRLAAVAQAVGDLDLNAIAATYKREVGCSGIEAAAAASAALNAALRGTLLGEGGAAAAEREVQAMAKKKARELQAGQFRAVQAKEEGPAGEVRRDQVREAIEARATKALDVKSELLTKDVAQRRADREERLAAAASRRALSEARAWLEAGRSRRRLPGASDDDSSGASAASLRGIPSPVADDPVLRRARALCSGVKRVTDDLDRQNEMLRQRVAALSAASRPPQPPAVQAASGPGPNVTMHGARFGAAHVVASAAEEAALIARAKELLADYKPADGRSRLGSARTTPSGSPKNANRGRAEKVNSVFIETTNRRSRLGRPPL